MIYQTHSYGTADNSERSVITSMTIVVGWLAYFTYWWARNDERGRAQEKPRQTSRRGQRPAKPPQDTRQIKRAVSDVHPRIINKQERP